MRYGTMTLGAAATALALVATLTSPASADDTADDRSVTSTIVISDPQTGEILYQDTEVVAISATDGTVTIDSPDVHTLPGEIGPQGTVEGSMYPGSVRSSITMQYSLKEDQIRTEKVWGSWTPDFGFELKDRHVRILSGGSLPSTIDRDPAANEWSYETGWGWQTKPPQNALTSPRTLAETSFRLSGTNGSWLRMSHWVDLSSV
ncbi:hypothetical protein PFZ55_52120 [Streptomyces sp. MS2A]|nr:hypothetical protein [Streptomyces sp. MS2A]